MDMDSQSQPSPTSVPSPGGEGEPSAPLRTFSVSVETRHSVAASMIDREEGAVVVYADPIHTKTATGTRISMGFPVLVVTGWIADPEDFAAKVAALLQEAQP